MLHLKHRHDVSVPISDTGAGQSQTQIDAYLKNVSEFSPAHTPYELNRDFTVWCSLDLLSFNFVTKQGMQYFFNKNFPSMQLPSRTTLSEKGLDDLYEMLKHKIMNEIVDSKISSICVMFDGWTDRKGLPYVGIRLGYIRKDWEYRVITLSCKVLQGHTADNLAAHVKRELEVLFQKRNVNIFTTHDGASNMMKASRLLHSCQVTHCVAHSLHLLLVTDGLQNVDDLNYVIEKCSNIITKLHFKGCELQNEKKNFQDVEAMDEIMRKISGAFNVLEAEEISPVQDTGAGDTAVSGVGADAVPAATGYGIAVHHRTLKKSVVTRWNSTLHMISSILDNFEPVDKILVRLGLRELRLDDDERAMLTELRDFLAPFENFTQMVSSTGALLSLIPLIKAEVYDSTSSNNPAGKKSHAAIAHLKRKIHDNIEKRLPITQAIKMASLFDPSTKNSALHLFFDTDASHNDTMNIGAVNPTTLAGNTAIVARISEIVHKDYIELLQFQQIEDSSMDTEPSSSNSVNTTAPSLSGEPLISDVSENLSQNRQLTSSSSFKLALINKMERKVGCQAMNSNIATVTCIQQELAAYLSPLSLTEEEKICPLKFWAKHVEYPLLSKIAKHYLTPSASSVPVECMFSITGLIDGAKRSSLDPYKVNQISFIHDNYPKFFRVKK